MPCPSFLKSKPPDGASSRTPSAGASSRCTCTSRACAGACRTTCPALVAGQRILHAKRRAQVPAARARIRHAAAAPGDVRAACACCPATRRASPHDHFDLLLDSGQHAAVQRSAPLRQPALHHRRSERASAAREARAGAVRRRVQRRLSVAHHAPPQGRDQTAADEQQARRRCRQHLRERSAVPGEDPAAAAGAQPDAQEVGTPRRARCARCCRWRFESAAPRCATTSAPTAHPGTSGRSSYVYERVPSPAGLPHAHPPADARPALDVLLPDLPEVTGIEMPAQSIDPSVAASTAILGGLIRAVGPIDACVETGCPPFQALAQAIAHQQLHGTAANTILGRFVGRCGEAAVSRRRRLCSPRSRSDSARRRDSPSRRSPRCRISPRRRSRASCPIARLRCWSSSDAEIIARLTQVRGIGRWTVEMLLMFQLGRPDILPVDDFGVRNGFRLAYGLRRCPRRGARAVRRALGAAPTAAAWYLWRANELHRAGRPAQTRGAGAFAARTARAKSGDAREAGGGAVATARAAPAGSAAASAVGVQERTLAARS